MVKDVSLGFDALVWAGRSCRLVPRNLAPVAALEEGASAAYEQYWDSLGDRAPAQSSPYDIINK